MDAVPPWWWAILAPAIPSAAYGAYQLLQLWFGRQDQREKRIDAYEDRRDASIARERDALAQSNAAILAGLRADLDRCRELLEATSRDRYRGWDLARFWYNLAWKMCGYARSLLSSTQQARQIAESAARLAGQPSPVWDTPIDMSLDLPPFDPKPPGAPP